VADDDGGNGRPPQKGSRESSLANYLLTQDGTLTTLIVKTSAYSDTGSDFDSASGFDDQSLDETEIAPSYLSGAENSEAVDAIMGIVERFQGDEFSISVAGGPIMEHHLWDRLLFETPDNLVNLLGSQKEGVLPGWVERIDDQKGNIHRFYVKFIIDDEPFALDASFKIERDTLWYSPGGSFGGLP
jgi:hypothetical protein